MFPSSFAVTAYVDYLVFFFRYYCSKYLKLGVVTVSCSGGNSAENGAPFFGSERTLTRGHGCLRACVRVRAPSIPHSGSKMAIQQSLGSSLTFFFALSESSAFHRCPCMQSWQVSKAVFFIVIYSFLLVVGGRGWRLNRSLPQQPFLGDERRCSGSSI